MMRNALRRIALFGAVAAMLSIAAIVIFSRATVSTGDLGTLKCYDITGAIEKPCDRPPFIVRTNYNTPH
jgi:uncharacterized membrane protein